MPEVVSLAEKLAVVEVATGVWLSSTGCTVCRVLVSSCCTSIVQGCLWDFLTMVDGRLTRVQHWENGEMPAEMSRPYFASKRSLVPALNCRCIPRVWGCESPDAQQKMDLTLYVMSTFKISSAVLRAGPVVDWGSVLTWGASKMRGVGSDAWMLWAKSLKEKLCLCCLEKCE
jgi:hypothetical protein